MEAMHTVYAKMGLGLNTSQTTHQANDHGTHMNIVKGKRTSLWTSFQDFAESFDEPGGKGAF